VKRLFDSDNVYVFQNHDRRLIFASPYERDFTLIGSVGHPFKGDPAVVSMAANDVAYLCDAANRYFRERVETADVVRTVAAANSVLGRGKRGLRRDGVLSFDVKRGRPPLVTIFGGDITTAAARRTRCRTVAFLSDVSPRWTDKTPLPAAISAGRSSRTRSSARPVALPRRNQARRIGLGLRLAAGDDSGRRQDRKRNSAALRARSTGAEVRYLADEEWARFPDDVLWRRTKLGLHHAGRRPREAGGIYGEWDAVVSTSRRSTLTSVGVAPKWRRKARLK
jgi:glycerol-3-phosphate dehydrogenase